MNRLERDAGDAQIQHIVFKLFIAVPVRIYKFRAKLRYHMNWNKSCPNLKAGCCPISNVVKTAGFKWISQGFLEDNNYVIDKGILV